MAILHENNEPCPVLELANQYFGDKGYNWLLENTCFPMSDEVAMEQLQKFIDEDTTRVK
jgi:hypothetical protein